ncbi:uncharacterized protein LOC108205218 [Daucus carota subsp. sativus]|uniref:Uncharacterized protein n=1 Tax=Daucus carota subsp. sativus TaxID=79200 RepID=A0A166JEU8_DAUCS|nr:PREDICTED: uncharacterized protein LOC108205218 [Daucus carota subsp. sativus]
MSRCFPFPPPGYERKPRPDDENLLEKEKRKERKHKKEKKDKNKKDRKEKKDKEGKQKKEKENSEDKHRERKDRKERHKHKKDKKKEKEKKRASEDKISTGPPECSTVDNPGSGCTQSDETSDIKFLVELGKRTRDDEKATENLMVKKINLTGKICSEYPEKMRVGKNGNSDGNAMLTEKRTNDTQYHGQSNNNDARCTENGIVQKIVLGQQRKVEGVAGLVGNNVEKRMVHNKIDEHIGSKSRGGRSNEKDRDGKIKSGAARNSEKEPNKEQLLVAREKSGQAACNNSNTGISPLPNEGNKNFNLGKRKELRINKFLHDDEIRPSKLQRPLSCAKEAVEDGNYLKLSKALTKSVPELAGMVNNHKLNSKQPSSHRTTEDRSKSKATSSAIQFASLGQQTGDNHKVDNSLASSHYTLENGRTLETLKAASLSASECFRSSINHKVDDKVGSARPVLENGVVHKAATLTALKEHEAIGHSKVDNKVNNNVPLSHSTSINGRILETSKAGSLPASECYRSSIKPKVDAKVGVAHPVLENGVVHGAATPTAVGGHESIDHSRFDSKEHKPNGLVKDKRANGSSTRPSSSTAKQIVGEYPKPPHPDSKYLSKILAIPSIEWSGFEEQEWLLGSNSESTKENPSSSQLKESKQVWDKALQLESADITALPYVIPY